MPDLVAHQRAEQSRGPESAASRERRLTGTPAALAAFQQSLQLQRSLGNQAALAMLPEHMSDQGQMTVGDLTQSLGPGRPLDEATRHPVQASTETDLGAVRVHEGAAADELCRAFNARAFTVGTDIVVAGSEYSPGTAEGRQLISHELAHVLQQGNRSAPSAQPLEIGAVTDPAEREADAAAGPVTLRDNSPEISAVPAGTIQRTPLPLPAGAPVFELNVDPDPIIYELELLSLNSKYTAIVDWNTHPIAQQIRGICGSNYFRGSRYWKSDWEDDGFNDILDLGIWDTDIMVELTLMVDNLRHVTSGEGEFKSGGETEEKTKTSQETTVSGDISGKAGKEDGPGAEAKVGIEHKAGHEREMSVKGAGDVTMKMGADIFLADVYVDIRLSRDTTFHSIKQERSPSPIRAGTLTYGRPGGPAKAGAAAGGE